MRVTKIEAEGACGKATLGRTQKGEVWINVNLANGQANRLELTGQVNPQGLCEQRKAARTLQQMLDGYNGTAGDVADYARLIEMLAD